MQPDRVLQGAAHLAVDDGGHQQQQAMPMETASAESSERRRLRPRLRKAILKS